VFGGTNSARRSISLLRKQSLNYTQKTIQELNEDRQKVARRLEALMLATVREEQQTAVEEAAEYLRFGVGRRLSAMRHCLNTVFDLFPPQEAKPLRSEQLHVVQISLQAFVINLSGIFDNFAWAFVLRHGLQFKELADKRGAPDRMKIGMFKPATQAFLPAELLAWANDAHTKTWQTDYLKTYRDALAHRIPLYIPPSRLTQEEAERFAEIQRLEIELIEAHRFDDLENLRAERDALGMSYPIYLETPKGRKIMLHPQMLCDGLTVLEFGELFFKHWRMRR
jgi:hypothetical protein